ncbi:aldehyde dehydrogenase family protein [Klebsiella pneumoniae subsp. pneumoniae]|nr:aldehyde dehydrogenase family protein [Klebsiella pneumoniae subsp. pneumoniae]
MQGFGKEAGEALATSKRIAKLAFTGSTPVGRHILACAAEILSPHRRAGGNRPTSTSADVMDGEEEFIEERRWRGWCSASSTRVRSVPARRGR